MSLGRPISIMPSIISRLRQGPEYADSGMGGFSDVWRGKTSTSRMKKVLTPGTLSWASHLYVRLDPTEGSKTLSKPFKYPNLLWNTIYYCLFSYSSVGKSSHLLVTPGKLSRLVFLPWVFHNTHHTKWVACPSPSPSSSEAKKRQGCYVSAFSS